MPRTKGGFLKSIQERSCENKVGACICYMLACPFLGDLEGEKREL